MAPSNLLLSYCATIFVVLIAVANGINTNGNNGWRTDPNYEPWTMKGTFLLGTPNTCQKPVTPQNGRWVCSYTHGENGRSLCILDCQRGFVVEGRPLIFNCVNGMWRMFPTPDTIIENPWGSCIPIEIYKAQMSMDDFKRSLDTRTKSNFEIPKREASEKTVSLDDIEKLFL
uniref:Cnidarian restricted protein n=1 Tax=Clytia hemisphaerica TaxID=252671 RepID=A0A7M5XC22_9CNID|eukprot:TCONS_00005780-protein